MIGKTLAHYEILELIGKGGMGEVYRARDTKLDREIALKVIPEELSRDPERLARFRREAKLLAALNHPNIAQVHGIEEDEGRIFLVMELAEGEDLEKRLQHGPLLVDEAVAVAHQIALGVEEAHEKGVVHRDLKPANVQVSPEGKVKVLDFGLARAFEGVDTPGGNPVDSPTITTAVTQKGVILGTAAYMSPEQARGTPVDRRADIWAFGVILFEMLGGHKLFAGATISDTMAAVLTREIDWEKLPKETPPHLRYLLRRCLERDRELRLRDIDEARVLLGERSSAEAFSSVALGIAVEPAAEAAGPKGRWARLVPWLLALGALGLWWSGRGGETPRHGPRPTEFQQLTTQSGVEHNPDIGADRRFFVYEATDGGDLDIFFQRVGGTKPINLTGNSDEDDDQPRLSPDGELVAFRSSRDGGGIFVMGATGESVRKLAPEGAQPEWSPDGSRIVYCTENFENPYSRNTISQLVVVDRNGTRLRELVTDDAVDPSWSPNGHRIAFWAVRDTSGGQRDLWSVSSEGGDERPITKDKALDWSPRWSADGRWLYYLSDRNGLMNLWRMPIDEKSGTPLGPAEPITLPAQGVASFALSADGRGLIFASSTLRTSILSHAIDPERGSMVAEPTTILGGSLLMHSFAVSPDGKWVVFASPGQREDLFLVREDGSDLRRLTDDIHRDRGPSWTPDGERILFYSDRAGRYDTFSVRPDGAGLTRVSTTTGRSHWYPRPDPGGRRVSMINETGTVLFEWDDEHTSLTVVETLPDPGPSERFFGWSWSRDGKRLLGWAAPMPSSDRTRLLVYHMEEDRYESLELDAYYWARPTWTREDRSIVYVDEDGLVQYDLDREQRHLLRPIQWDRAGMSDYTLSEVNGKLYLIDRSTASDLLYASLE